MGTVILGSSSLSNKHILIWPKGVLVKGWLVPTTELSESHSE